MAVIARHETNHTGTIENIAFYPDLTLEDFQQLYRVDNKVDAELLTQSITSNMMEVNAELSQWKKAKQEEGYSQLSAVPAEHYGKEGDGLSELIIAYRQAVYARTKADVLRHFGNYDLTNDGDEKWNDQNDQARFYDRESTKAIRKINNKTATRVSLI